ncbi:TetR/AcrR family transcriptional regulator [Parafrankia sp. BMG5.11]|uniref:TetR/AcrR family transcriptional regulator n=1 Tax=Parafrankia sp. BMG5.11 TaxID=222540 RepID=UPI000DA4522D|nr:TetR/AcrR family transcriptional regulator [Parafrankia sp. BMG5.11]TCJ33092.1 TetR/AcrR family transcriptional regulator [Parafrankia sp. BMG5.11]SQD93892.1 Transcriptional regulator, TetR family [Parafrankia sp. Ea1.12]
MVDTAYVAGEGALRRRLVEVGTAMLDEGGLAAVSLRAIARQAGVSHGAPRRHFPTHAALLAAIAAEGLADLASRLAGVRAAGEAAGASPHECVVDAGSAYVRFARERPAMFELMFRHDILVGSGENLRERSLPLFDAWTDLVRAALPALPAGAGAGAPEQVRRRALLAWTHLHGIAVLAANESLGLVTASPDPTELVVEAIGVHLCPDAGPH